MQKNIEIGQIWLNGKAAVKVQGKPGALQLVLFDMDSQQRLRFKDELVMDEVEAIEFLEGHNCVPTDKKLVAI